MAEAAAIAVMIAAVALIDSTPLRAHVATMIAGQCFPAVPTCHLPELSRRLDRAAPEYKDLTVY